MTRQTLSDAPADSGGRWEARWASTIRALGWPTPEELEAEGWERLQAHPVWPHSVLMRRPLAEGPGA